MTETPAACFTPADALAWLQGPSRDDEDCDTQAEALGVAFIGWSPTGNDGYLSDLANAAIRAGLFGDVVARFWLIADGTGHVDGAIVTAELPDGRRGASEFTRLREFNDDGLAAAALAVFALGVVAVLIQQAIRACSPMDTRRLGYKPRAAGECGYPLGGRQPGICREPEGHDFPSGGSTKHVSDHAGLTSDTQRAG